MEKVEFRIWDKKNKRYLNKVDNPVVMERRKNESCQNIF